MSLSRGTKQDIEKIYEFKHKNVKKLQDALINHAKKFGSLMDMKGNVNIEYLAGIELILISFDKIEK